MDLGGHLHSAETAGGLLL